MNPAPRQRGPSTHLALLLAAGLVVAAACGGRPDSSEPGPEDRQRATPIRLKVTDRGGRTVVMLRSGGKSLHLELSLAGETLIVDGERSGKLRRYSSAAAVVAEASDEDGVTRARSADGRQLFELWGSGRRVRALLGEPPGRLVVFARPAPERLRLLAGEKEPEIGRVTHDGGKSRVRVRDPQGRPLYESSSPRLSALFAVLLLKDLPDLDKAILMAELLWNGQ